MEKALLWLTAARCGLATAEPGNLHL
ncbi:MAG: hypothetical protein QOD46_235, partial [Actinomycetota bacterium]|nr:hypothetical protein [Actinomycetota bacterium]